jgi:hypothetical protein
MKFPSLKNLYNSFIAVFSRFPAEVLFALTGTIAASAYVELNAIQPTASNWLLRVIMTANLGFLLSLSTSLFCESRLLPRLQTILLKTGAVIVAVTLLFLLDPYNQLADKFRFFLLSLSFHLLVAFVAYTQKGQVQGFWQFNKTLFLRFFAGALYSGVLFAGLSAAMAAVNFLFNVSFEWDSFLMLWIWIAGMFSTSFFLAGVPADLKALDADNSYPKGLKVFTQFVLIPLATIYVLILLAYEAKILLQWSLPQGLVSNLILGYAVFGILSLLLIFPVRNQEGNKWIKTYARSFYILLLPLLVLLFLAVGTRVLNYGITEYRYFLIALACWLLFISVYFLVSSAQNIKLIPISLCVMALLAVYGPQSAVSVSLSSQRHILENIFNQNKAFSNGLLFPIDSTRIKRAQANRAVGILDYLINHNNFTALQPYFKQDLRQVGYVLGKQKSSWRNGLPVSKSELVDRELTWVKKQLNLNLFSGSIYGDDTDTTMVTFNAQNYELRIKDPEVKRVSGYDYTINFESTFINADTLDSDTTNYLIQNVKVSAIKKVNSKYRLIINKQAAEFDIQHWVDSIVATKALSNYKDTKINTDYATNYRLPAEKLTVVKRIGKHRVALCINEISLDHEPKHNKIQHLEATYLIKW